MPGCGKVREHLPAAGLEVEGIDLFDRALGGLAANGYE